MAIVSDDLQIPDLIAYALYEADDRARSFHRPLQIFLASLALFENEQPMSSNDLVAAVSALLPSSGLDPVGFDETLSQGIAAGLIEARSPDVLSLSPDRRRELAAAAQRVDANRAAFHETIRLSVEGTTGDLIVDKEAQRLAGKLEHYLLRFFHDYSATIATAFGPHGRGFDEVVTGLEMPKLEQVLVGLVPSSEVLRSTQVLDGIQRGLLNLDLRGKAHLATLYHKTVSFALLRQDPTIQRVKRTLAERRIVYLDTNVLMALMFEEQPMHDLALEVVRLVRSVNCEMRVSRFTVEELDFQLERSDNRFKRLKQAGGALAFVKDDVIRTYHAKKGRLPGLEWKAFLAEFTPTDAWFRDIGIAPDDFPDWANAVHDDRAQSVRSKVQAIKAATRKGPLHPKLVDFDVFNLLYIQLRRKVWKADEMGSRVWLVTMDTSLARAETELVAEGTYRVPASHSAEAWCEFIGPYVAPDTPALDDYVTHVLHSQMGLLGEDPLFVSTNFLITLEEARFDIAGLLSVGPARARNVLIALQEDAEVKRLVETDDSEKRSADWANKLVEAVEGALESMKRDPTVLGQVSDARRERDQARAAERIARRERDRERRASAQLREERDRFQQRASDLEPASRPQDLPLLRRLLRRLRKPRQTQRDG
jgi:hypothetical protein